MSYSPPLSYNDAKDGFKKLIHHFIFLIIILAVFFAVISFLFGFNLSISAIFVTILTNWFWLESGRYINPDNRIIDCDKILPLEKIINKTNNIIIILFIILFILPLLQLFFDNNWLVNRLKEQDKRINALECEIGILK